MTYQGDDGASSLGGPPLRPSDLFGMETGLDAPDVWTDEFIRRVGPAECGRCGEAVSECWCVLTTEDEARMFWRVPEALVLNVVWAALVDGAGYYDCILSGVAKVDDLVGADSASVSDRERYERADIVVSSRVLPWLTFHGFARMTALFERGEVIRQVVSTSRLERAERARFEVPDSFWGAPVVYVLQAGERPVFKIGVTTKCIRERVKQLQTGVPDPISVVGVVEVASAGLACSLESLLHKRYARFRAFGEWFHLPGYALAEIRALPCVDSWWCDR